MIALDTNVLLRLLIEDDPTQCKAARDAVEGACTPESPGFISLVVLVECLWVLKSGYGYDEDARVRAVEWLMETDALRVQDAPHIGRALTHARKHGVDVVDAIIAALGVGYGATHTLTFDRKAARLPLFRQIEIAGV